MSLEITFILTLILIAVILISVIVFKFKKADLDIRLLPFFSYLLFGKGFRNIRTKALQMKIDKNGNGLLIANLSILPANKLDIIPGTQVLHFDDFIRETVIESRYDKNKQIIIVCDHGRISRVAASILAEEGYKNVYNLIGGIKKWREQIKRNRKNYQDCSKRFLFECCR
jgi:rhodanese-related sulfurtransferase